MIFTSCLLALFQLFGCKSDLPQIELNQTPAPENIANGNYRLKSMVLHPTAIGADLDGDTTADNNFPIVLDTLYFYVEASMLSILSNIFDTQEELDLAWEIVSSAMVASGLPLSSETYTTSINNGINDGSVNFLTVLYAPKEEYTTVDFYTGYPSFEGYNKIDSYYGKMTGKGESGLASLSGQMTILYPYDDFYLLLDESKSDIKWNSNSFESSLLSGKIPLETIVYDVVSLIPDTITIYGQTIDLTYVDPLLEESLYLALSLAVDSSGDPLFDVTLADSGDLATSAAFSFYGYIANIINSDEK